ncbi:MAG: hypothetical protein AAF438_20635 [Pseudomonadota bacterium]
MLLQHPTFDDEGRFPFQFETIRAYQQADTALQKKLSEHPEKYILVKFGQHELICVEDQRDPKIVIPEEMLTPLIKYFHQATSHVEGMRCLAQTVKRHFYHPRIESKTAAQVKRCTICQRYRRGGRIRGHAAPREANIMPWEEVHCDTIGPWSIELRGRKITFRAMTMVDPATNLVEIKDIHSDTAVEGAAAVENTWLSRYPRPEKCVSDQGSEFGYEFVTMLQNNGIRHAYSTSRNPRGNAMIERTHQSIGQVLRTVVATKTPKSVHEANMVIQECLATAMHACRCATQGAIGNLTPGALAFHRDMFLNVPLFADLITLQKHRQGLIDKRLLRANAQRIKHEYIVGNKVWKRRYLNLSDKLQSTMTGPFPITQVHTNGTVTIQLKPDVQERINIRRIQPFQE